MQLARKAIAERRTLEEVVSAAKRSTRRSPTPTCCATAAAAAAHAPGSGALPGDGHRAHASRQRGGARFDAPEVDKQDAELTDSMKMFKWGVEGGKPQATSPACSRSGSTRATARNVVACGRPLASPDFAEDHGEEPELVGCYVIDDNGRPHRLGFAIGNEFSDHVTERRNYLLLAHSKLRQCGVGPMLNTGALPAHLEGTSRIRRDGAVLWQKPFLTGEGNMSHSFANLEYHHFKYRQHRVPGDVHLHFFGTATLSFVDNIKVQPGDEFEIDLPALGRAARQPARRRAGRPSRCTTRRTV